MVGSSKTILLLKIISLTFFFIAGLNLFGPNLFKSINIVQSTTELPLAHLRGIVVDQQGNIYLGSQFYGRIQMYDATGNFQKGWFIDTNGGLCRLKINEKNQLEVATARSNLHYIFDQNWNILSIHEDREAFIDFGDDNEYLYTLEDNTTYTIELPMIWPEIVKITSRNQSESIIRIKPYHWFFIGIVPAMIFGLIAIVLSSLIYKSSRY